MGLPSWLIRRGIGSFLTIGFGDPCLTVHNPRPETIEVSGERLQVATRLTTVHGQWHLWIYCCSWALSAGDHLLAHCESNDDIIARGLRVLDGQALSSVTLDGARTTFRFDLGCTLEAWPDDDSLADEPVEQWMLCQPSGHVLSLRSDGLHSSGAAGERIDRWLPHR